MRLWRWARLEGRGRKENVSEQKERKRGAAFLAVPDRGGVDIAFCFGVSSFDVSSKHRMRIASKRTEYRSRESTAEKRREVGTRLGRGHRHLSTMAAGAAASLFDRASSRRRVSGESSRSAPAAIACFFHTLHRELETELCPNQSERRGETRAPRCRSEGPRRRASSRR